MNVIIKYVDRPPVQLDASPSTFRMHCNGRLEAIDFPNMENVTIYCNEEYLLNGSMANVMLPEYNNFICDNLVVCGFDPETGKDRDLTKEECDEVMKYLTINSLYHTTPGMAYYRLQQRGDS